MIVVVIVVILLLSFLVYFLSLVWFIISIRCFCVSSSSFMTIRWPFFIFFFLLLASCFCLNLESFFFLCSCSKPQFVLLSVIELDLLFLFLSLIQQFYRIIALFWRDLRLSLARKRHIKYEKKKKYFFKVKNISNFAKYFTVQSRSLIWKTQQNVCITMYFPPLLYTTTEYSYFKKENNIP